MGGGVWCVFGWFGVLHCCNRFWVCVVGFLVGFDGCVASPAVAGLVCCC